MTKLSLRLRADHMGTPVHTISLYDRSDDVTEEGLVGAVISALTPQTRVVAITWVQSATGVKMPVGRIAQELAHINLSRSEEDQYFFVWTGYTVSAWRTSPSPIWDVISSSQAVTNGSLGHAAQG
jgi:hypothetical protein